MLVVDENGAEYYQYIRSSYLDTEKSAGGEDGHAVIRGTIGQQVGYLRVARMEKIASGEDSIEVNLTAINTIMKDVLIHCLHIFLWTLVK